MKALVTGATGFVGAAVARALLAAGHEVRALVRTASDPRNLASLEVERATGDLRDPGSLETAVRGCDAVFHVAADYRLWVPDPAEMYAVNVDGSRRLVEAAASAGVETLVYTSSVATLGINADGTPADEETPVGLADMTGHYKRSKYLAERAVREAAAATGQAVVTVNPSTPLGRGDLRPTPTGRIVLDAVAGRMPAYVETGLNIVHVDDVAAGHLLALERGTPGERYVLGGEDMTLGELLAVVADCCGRAPPRLRIPHTIAMGVAFAAEGWAHIAGGEPRATRDAVRMSRKHMYFSSAKAARELGYSARPARQAIEEAAEWFASGAWRGDGG